jgi:DnaJ-class molecular chaperone
MNTTYYDHNGKMINFYEILNIPYHADKKLVRSAFCNLVRMYHSDITGKNTASDRERVDLIIKGYKLLTDDKLRAAYTQILFNKYRFNNDGYIYLNHDRIKYFMSLKDFVTEKMLISDFKNKKICRSMHDIEIFITKTESEKGAVAVIELPSRMICTCCHGSQEYCHICNGVGRISAVSQVEIKIYPFIKYENIITIDLTKIKPGRFIYFALKKIKVKISIISN